jgi:glyoxylase-like metal-dependent hydrolase (beta-lactamase superfamily II)
MEKDSAPSIQNEYPYAIAEDVIGIKLMLVNIYLVGERGEGNPWMLVDAGVPGSAKRIRKEAEKLFGKNNPPKCIVLTHGHFDHVGSLQDLLKDWPSTRVYAHPYEIPYLTGKMKYPHPDPLAGDGAMAYMSWLFPTDPINLGDQVFPMADRVSQEEFADWKIIETPGHSPGHVSLYRQRDQVLIAGDAFTTTDQNALMAVMTQKKEMHGPPAYFTINWRASRNSIEKLTELDLRAAGTGHGLPVFGEELREGLYDVLDHFEIREVPMDGHYVMYPLDISTGAPPRGEAPDSFRKVSGIGKMALATLAGLGLVVLIKSFSKD